MGVQDYNRTPGNNSSLSGIALGENAMLGAKLNDAVRQLMADLAAASKAVATFADLRTTTQHATGDLVLAIGGEAGGDGRGGLFKWDAASTQADDGAVFLRPDDVESGDPGRWVRVVDGPVEVAWYVDPGEDATAGGNAAVAAAVALGVNAIRLRTRDWLFSASDSVEITTSDFSVLIEPGSRITKTSPTYYPIFEFVNADRVSLVGTGATVTNTTVERIEHDYSASTTYDTTWKIHNYWDVNAYTIFNDDTTWYSHPVIGTSWTVAVLPSELGRVTRAESRANADKWVTETFSDGQPVILFRDCSDVVCEGISIDKGGIVSRAETQDCYDIVFRNCRASHFGITSLNNHVEEFRYTNHVPATSWNHKRYTIENCDAIGVLDATWYGNGIHEEATGGTATAHYAKFYERVDGIYIDGFAEQGVIQNCRCRFNRGEGIRPYSANGLTIADCVIEYSGVSGLGPENTTGAPRSKRVIVSGTRVAYSTWDGVDLNCGSFYVNDAVARGRPYADYYEEVGYVFTGCFLEGNGLEGLSERPDSNGGEGGCGIFMWSAGLVEITGCTVRNSNLAGIRGDGCYGISIVGNHIYNNGRSDYETSNVSHAGVVARGWQQSLVQSNNFTASTRQSALLGQKWGVYEEVLTRTDPTSNPSPAPAYTIESIDNRFGPNIWAEVHYSEVPTFGQTEFVLRWPLSSVTGLLYLRFCTNAGRAWATSTNYAVGAAVYNGNRIYRCSTGGISAAAGGGPTVTTGTEADNTVTWTYVGQTLASGANLTEGVDYTVSGLGTATVTVTLASAPTPGNRLEFRLIEGLASAVESTYGTKQYTHLINRTGFAAGAYQQPMMPWIATQTAGRPTLDSYTYGVQFFDVTLGRYGGWNGTTAIDMEGRQFDKAIIGATGSRPTGLNSTTDRGFRYWDTTLGYPIWWAGAGWVKYDGTAP